MLVADTPCCAEGPAPSSPTARGGSQGPADTLPSGPWLTLLLHLLQKKVLHGGLLCKVRGDFPLAVHHSHAGSAAEEVPVGTGTGTGSALPLPPRHRLPRAHPRLNTERGLSGASGAPATELRSVSSPLASTTRTGVPTHGLLSHSDPRPRLLRPGQSGHCPDGAPRSPGHSPQPRAPNVAPCSTALRGPQESGKEAVLVRSFPMPRESVSSAGRENRTTEADICMNLPNHASRERSLPLAPPGEISRTLRGSRITEEMNGKFYMLSSYIKILHSTLKKKGWVTVIPYTSPFWFLKHYT